MLSSSAQFTAVAAPHDPRVHPVGSARPVMPVGQADADDADDASHHGKRGGASWCTKQSKPVTILKPMCRINMTPEGDPQVALAASHTRDKRYRQRAFRTVFTAFVQFVLQAGLGGRYHPLQGLVHAWVGQILLNCNVFKR